MNNPLQTPAYSLSGKSFCLLFPEIIGNSPALERALEQLLKVAPTDTTVLLEGETGTGKELFARAVHQASPRKNKRPLTINCAALPANLIESELFGHERGAFTGAVERRIGKFEAASGSTLFLDEIGELPLELQAKLLRAIQEKEIERLGSNKVIRCDVRLVAATNRNLAAQVAAGRFRADLYYRLSVFPLCIPPLRERGQDVVLLARHFLQTAAKRLGKDPCRLSAESLDKLHSYAWPGNVRELEHTIERALILSDSPVVQLKNFLPPANVPGPAATVGQATPSVRAPLVKTLQQAERENILAVLRITGGRIRGEGGAAQLLAVKPTTLDHRIRKLGIGKVFRVQESFDLNP
jgi:transcriptional regulator with GAF, ATPase, and Fis domain